MGYKERPLLMFKGRGEIQRNLLAYKDIPGEKSRIMGHDIEKFVRTIQCYIASILRYKRTRMLNKDIVVERVQLENMCNKQI